MFGILREVSADSLNIDSEVDFYGSALPECAKGTPDAYHMITDPLLAWMKLWRCFPPANLELSFWNEFLFKLDGFPGALSSSPELVRDGTVSLC